MKVRILLATVMSAFLVASGSSVALASPSTAAYPSTQVAQTVLTGVTGSSQTATGSVAPPGWGSPAPPSYYIYPSPTALSGLSTMYDSTDLNTVPANPFALAGYTSGFWPTYQGMREKWPKAHVVSIAISTRHHADCLDVEPGDAEPWEVPGWVRADKATGEFSRPCVYSSFWEYVNEIRPILASNGINRSEVWEWDADYTYVSHIDRTFDATQWTDKEFGLNLDASLVLNSFLSIAQPPYSPNPGPSRHQLEAELAAHLKIHGELVRDIANDRVYLITHGCRYRVEHHKPLGPKCQAAFKKGNFWHRHLATEDRIIGHIREELRNL